jgi:LysM repeat protein
MKSKDVSPPPNTALSQMRTSYTVERGDTLLAICGAFDIDYHVNIDIIKAVNGIENPSAIYAGQWILLSVRHEQV